jgi:hypothetical protein
MFNHFKSTHLPILFMASALTFGGMLPLPHPQAAIREMDIPARVHASPAAQTIVTLGMGRTTVIDIVLWTF